MNDQTQGEHNRSAFGCIATKSKAALCAARPSRGQASEFRCAVAEGVEEWVEEVTLWRGEWGKFDFVVIWASFCEVWDFEEFGEDFEEVTADRDEFSVIEPGEAVVVEEDGDIFDDEVGEDGHCGLVKSAYIGVPEDVGPGG